MVVEQSEVSVEPNVDARGLHHLWVPRVEHDGAGIDAGADVTVAEQHNASVVTSVPGCASYSVLIRSRRGLFGFCEIGAARARAKFLVEFEQARAVVADEFHAADDFADAGLFFKLFVNEPVQ